MLGPFVLGALSAFILAAWRTLYGLRPHLGTWENPLPCRSLLGDFGDSDPTRSLRVSPEAARRGRSDRSSFQSMALDLVWRASLCRERSQARALRTRGAPLLSCFLLLSELNLRSLWSLGSSLISCFCWRGESYGVLCSLSRNSVGLHDSCGILCAFGRSKQRLLYSSDGSVTTISWEGERSLLLKRIPPPEGVSWFLRSLCGKDFTLCGSWADV